MDGEKLRGLAGACLQHVLRKGGGYLRPDLAEDLHEYLVLVALETAARYDPSRSRPGYSFASLIWDVMELRSVDWYRRNLGDSRQRPEVVEARRQFSLPLSLDDLTGTDVPAVQDDPFADDMDAAAATLAESLSPENSWTLAHLARPLAEGAKITTAAHEAGLTLTQARRLPRELREELEAA